MTEWIKCSDRMPETKVRALVYDNIINRVMIANYCPIDHAWYWDYEMELPGPDKDDFSHWLPIPELPEDLK